MLYPFPRTLGKTYLVVKNNGEVGGVGRDHRPDDNVGAACSPASGRIGLGDRVGKGRGGEGEEGEDGTHDWWWWWQGGGRDEGKRGDKERRVFERTWGVRDRRARRGPTNYEIVTGRTRRSICPAKHGRPRPSSATSPAKTAPPQTILHHSSHLKTRHRELSDTPFRLVMNLGNQRYKEHIW